MQYIVFFECDAFHIISYSLFFHNTAYICNVGTYVNFLAAFCIITSLLKEPVHIFLNNFGTWYFTAIRYTEFLQYYIWQIWYSLNCSLVFIALCVHQISDLMHSCTKAD